MDEDIKDIFPDDEKPKLPKKLSKLEEFNKQAFLRMQKSRQEMLDKMSDTPAGLSKQEKILVDKISNEISYYTEGLISQLLITAYIGIRPVKVIACAMALVLNNLQIILETESEVYNKIKEDKNEK